MPQKAVGSLRPSNILVRSLALVALLAGFITPRFSYSETYAPPKVLFVANGNYSQETYIQNHLMALGATVTKMKDYQVKSTTNFAAYNLILITEFAPNIPSTALAKIKTAGVPVLIMEYWDFWYSYKLGLTTTDDCGYVGATKIEHIAQSGRIDDLLGNTPTMYTSSFTMYGIASEDLASSAVPLAFSSRSFDEFAVIEDPERHIVATGVYDTRKYTVAAWRYFDLLIDRIVGIGPGWTDIQEELDGFAESGLMSYLDHLTGREDPSTVKAFVWKMMFSNNLWDFQYPIEEQLVAVNTSFSLSVDINPIFELPPCTAYDFSVYPDMCWMLGQHRQGDSIVVPNYGDVVGGADLGVSVERWGRTFFYMGDTWGYAGGDTDCERAIGIGRAECDDAIVKTAPGEGDPSDGVTLEIVEQDSTWSQRRYRPVNIDGVHRSFDSAVWADWSGDTDEWNNGAFSVPTGALVHPYEISEYVPPFGNYSAYYKNYPLQKTQLWYVTQSTRSAVTNPSDIRAGKSWVGCSFDGKEFSNCYDYDNQGQTDYAYFSKDKFMQVSPVFVHPLILDTMNPSPPHTDAGGFLLYGAGHPFRCSPIYLAYVDVSDFGTVNWSRPKNIYYYSNVTSPAIWTTDDTIATPLVPYTGCLMTEQEYINAGLGDEWNKRDTIWHALIEEYLWEFQAEYFPGCSPSSCDTSCTWTFTNFSNITCTLCGDTDIALCADAFVAQYMEVRRPMPDATSGFGEISVKSVGGTGFSGFVLISSHGYVDESERAEILAAIDAGTFHRNDFKWNNNRIYLRTAPADQPWALSNPIDTGNTGYGPYIIDAFTEITPSMSGGNNPIPGFTVSLWHTTSPWRGPFLPGAYGTYTTQSSFWVPEIE